MKASLPSWLSGLLVLIVIPFFFVGGPSGSSSLLLNNVWNFGHIIFFALFMLLVQSFIPLTNWKKWVWVTIVTLLIGGMIEVVQHFVGRDSSMGDILHNVFGVWLGLFWGQKPTRVIWWFRLASTLLIVPALWMVFDSAVANLAMRNQFPLINSFESRYELQQVHRNNSGVKIQQNQLVHTHGSHAVHVSLNAQPYAGVNLIGSYGDWGGYTALSMDLHNADREPLELTIRISDYPHDRGDNNFDDRFNRRVLLVQGWNQVQIDLNDVRSAPHERDMQMNLISGMTIFAAGLSHPREFYIDNIRLD